MYMYIGMAPQKPLEKSTTDLQKTDIGVISKVFSCFLFPMFPYGKFEQKYPRKKAPSAPRLSPPIKNCKDGQYWDSNEQDGHPTRQGIPISRHTVDKGM